MSDKSDMEEFKLEAERIVAKAMSTTSLKKYEQYSRQCYIMLKTMCMDMGKPHLMIDIMESIRKGVPIPMVFICFVRNLC